MTGWIIAIIIYSILWASVCMVVSKNKGYEYEADKWFAIGFLLGVFGFLMVISKPTMINTNDNQAPGLKYSNLHSENVRPQSSSNYYYPRPEKADTWVCNCGARNRIGENYCHRCGSSQFPKAKAASVNVNTAVSENGRSSDAKQKSVAEQTSGYKAMFDSGLITEEEFTAKKKQILGL